MMTTTVHTNISSTSVDGITALRMMMVDIGRPGVWVTRAGYESGVDRESLVLLPNGVMVSH